MEYRIIQKMVVAMEIANDELVLLNFWGGEEETADLELFERAFQELGIHTIAVVHSQKSFEEAKNEQWYEQFEKVDAVVDIMNHAPGMPPRGIKEEQLPEFAEHLKKMFGLFSKKEKLIQITMPTDENAGMAEMEPEQFKERTMKALDIDYAELKRSCREKITEMQGTERIIRTGEDCVLRMDTGSREWLIDAGEGAFPCGEIYIAPLEDRTQGEIYFETFAVDDLGVYKNVTLKIEHGRVKDSNCPEFNEFLKQLPEGGDVVAELGIGMNPNVSGVRGDSSLDENALGTFHIAIGMNHLFGGNNCCPVHFDFVSTGSIE